MCTVPLLLNSRWPYDFPTTHVRDAWYDELQVRGVSFAPSLEGLAPEPVQARLLLWPEELALLFVGLGDLALIQHWGSGGAWPTLDELPELIVDVFLDGAAPRGPRRRRR